MKQLEQIEQQFNFKYPDLYKKLYDDGMLDCGEYSPNWHSIYWEKFKTNPPFLFFGHDIELLDFTKLTAQVVEKIKAFKDPNDYLKSKPEFQFVPFAMTGAGDLYVFQFDKAEGGNVPITLTYHDENNAVVLAKNLQDFTFRVLLECVVEIDEYSTVAEDDNFKDNLFNMLKTHKPYLTQRHIEKLEEIYSRALFEYKYKMPNGREFSATGLISRNELEETLKQEIGFDNLDKEFAYRY
jgi:hypothetical protein